MGCTHPSRGLACEPGFVLGLCVAAPLPSPYSMTRQSSHRVLGMERARLVPPFGAVVDGGFLVTGAPQTLQPAARAQWLHLLFLMRSTWHAAAHTEVMRRPGRRAHAAPPPAVPTTARHNKKTPLHLKAAGSLAHTAGHRLPCQLAPAERTCSRQARPRSSTRRRPLPWRARSGRGAVRQRPQQQLVAAELPGP